MTVKECKAREQEFFRLAEEIGESLMFGKSDKDLLILALMRSITAERLNIAELKRSSNNKGKKIKVIDRIQKMTVEELSAWLCDLVEDCSRCPAESECHRGHKGFLDYLQAEWGGDDT